VDVSEHETILKSRTIHRLKQCRS